MAAPNEVAQRLAQIRARIHAVCARAGRDPAEVTLVGASKMQPVAAMQAAWEAGLRVFGENRVQEAERKLPALPRECEWHLLGPLQSNKVKAAANLFTVFHAIDRPKIARALAKEAADHNLQLDGFLEINLGGEASKHGFAPANLAGEARGLTELRGLRLVGLMAIPPQEEEPEAIRRWFRRLRFLRDELRQLPEWRDFPGLLSMGMSEDFELAIEEGATHVRVGTALFGAREG